MSGGRLTPLQQRILRVLARLEPPWTLTGGGALVGFHLAHRETRDLDLFWRKRRELGELVANAVGAITGTISQTVSVLIKPIDGGMSFRVSHTGRYFRF